MTSSMCRHRIDRRAHEYGSRDFEVAQRSATRLVVRFASQVRALVVVSKWRHFCKAVRPGLLQDETLLTAFFHLQKQSFQQALRFPDLANQRLAGGLGQQRMG